MWTNITDEDIEKADDEVMNPDEGAMGDGLFGDFEQGYEEQEAPAPEPPYDEKHSNTPEDTKEQQLSENKIREFKEARCNEQGAFLIRNIRQKDREHNYGSTFVGDKATY